MTTDFLDLLEMEDEDQEYIPEILPIDARLSIRGPAQLLQTLFERAVAVAPQKELIPGTSYTQFDAYDSSEGHVSFVKVTATDGEQTVSVVGDGVSVSKSGTALLPGDKVLKILKLAPDEIISITVLGNTATFRSGRALWTIQTPHTDSLPSIPQVDSIQLFPVNRKSFLRAIAIAKRAVAVTGSRPALMQAQVADGAITSCDGARFHRQEILEFPMDLNFTIPLRFMDEMSKALRSTDEELVLLGADDLHLIVRVNQDVLISQKLLVKYPDIENLLLAPAMLNKYELSVNGEELEDVVKRVRVNADPDHASISLAVSPIQDSDSWNVSIHSRDRYGNTSTESIVGSWTGPRSVEVTLNHKYLIDLLDSYSQKTVVFKLGEDSKTKKSPILLQDPEQGFTGFIQQSVYR